MTVVRVPASTANLGPGFDALAMALTLTADMGVVDAGTTIPEHAAVVDERHPATVAFARARGRGTLWVRSPIPMGRGLGFSGAMRVGGAAVAVVQRAGVVGLAEQRAQLAAGRPEILAVAADLEGHADNAAASLHGGMVATDGTRAVRFESPLRPDVVVWIPPDSTSTAASRSALPAAVPFADAVFNIGRTALLVAALVAGDVDALATATGDRLHQDQRFVTAQPSRAALESGLVGGAWCGWLSGSGPTVALLAAAGDGVRIAATLPADGHSKVLGLHLAGATVVR